MNYKIKKKFSNMLKAVTSSTLLRKKKKSFNKIKNIKHLNIKQKLQLTKYNTTCYLLKNISIYTNFQDKLTFNSISI